MKVEREWRHHLERTVVAAATEAVWTWSAFFSRFKEKPKRLY